ncbi:unnamed protein product [Rotaria sp. Silwood2]|nr:unnamed protein product [Rotaria sp. Silwood2]
MGSGSSNSSTRCCGSVQDWCRDVCGCCPCQCCKTVKIQLKTKQTIENKIEKTEIPFGFSLLHAGIRMTDNVYTSPVLEIHTWRRAMTQIAVNEAATTQRIALGGIQTARDTADHHLGPAGGVERRKLELEEEITVIPIESIISIKSASDVKKGQTEYKTLRQKTPVVIQLSCCERIVRWCNRTFCCCCCCCDNSNHQINNEPEQIITTISNQEAERKILITIEYIRYSNIHTPSHIRVLPTTDQGTFYKEHLHTDILKFYLLDNIDFEQIDFDVKRMQAATLCRLVTQLKSMIGHYPNEQTLEQLINRQGSLAIGDPPKETIERLLNPGKTVKSLEAPISLTCIKNRP